MVDVVDKSAGSIESVVIDRRSPTDDPCTQYAETISDTTTLLWRWVVVFEVPLPQYPDRRDPRLDHARTNVEDQYSVIDAIGDEQPLMIGVDLKSERCWSRGLNTSSPRDTEVEPVGSYAGLI